jgi:hypothetical protein
LQVAVEVGVEGSAVLVVAEEHLHHLTQKQTLEVLAQMD